jgi:large conductance mechanosensitive channel
MRGNVLDLAIAVIPGFAFNAVVDSLVNDVLMQVIAAIVGTSSFNDLPFEIGDGVIDCRRFASLRWSTS